MLDAVPNFGRSFREPEQFAVFRVDYDFVNQEVHVKGATPIIFAHKYDRQRPDFAGLHEGQDLKRLIEGAIATRKGHQRFRAADAACAMRNSLFLVQTACLKLRPRHTEAKPTNANVTTMATSVLLSGMERSLIVFVNLWLSEKTRI